MKNIINSPYRKLKIFLILPVFAIILYSFATPEYHYISSTENEMTVAQAPEIFAREVKVIGYANNPKIDTAGQKRQFLIRSSNPSKFDIDPLIVVDGIVTDIDVNELDPSTIESVSVLKDKSAMNKYGEKGINGVIEITTKRIKNE